MPLVVSTPLAKRKTSDELADQIEALAASLEGGLKHAILGYLLTHKDAVSLKALIEAIESGSIAKVLDIITGTTKAAAAQGVTDAIASSVWAGAVLATSNINMKLRGAAFAFDKLNPQLLEFINGYSFELIRRIDEQTVEAIKEVMHDGMKGGHGAAKIAREIKQAIGLTPKQSKAVSNFRKELETFHLRSSATAWNLGEPIDRVNGHQVIRIGPDGKPLDGIEARRLRDFRFDKTLIKAMQTGKPLTPEQIDKMVAAYERKYLRYRSETIATTEALRTTNQGVQEAWRQAIQTGKADALLVRRQWIVAKDERRCAHCSAVPGMNHKLGVPFDQPFKTPHGALMLPPLHPRCRCVVFIRQYEPIQIQNAA